MFLFTAHKIAHIEIVNFYM